MEMASPGNRDCANCISTFSFPIQSLSQNGVSALGQQGCGTYAGRVVGVPGESLPVYI